MKKTYYQHMIKYNDVSGKEISICTVWTDDNGDISELPMDSDMLLLLKMLMLGRDVRMESTGQSVEDEV